MDNIEKSEDGLIRINKIPLDDLLTILETLYESGANFIDLEFKILPEEEQNVVTINTRPEYMATEEELEQERIIDEEFDDDDEDEEDDILDIIKKRQAEDSSKPISDDELNELI